jgi:hypothetical protein
MNANVAITALVSGDVDYTMLFDTSVRAALRGFPVKGIAGSITKSTRCAYGMGQNRAADRCGVIRVRQNGV